MIDTAKREPGKLTFSSAGVGSTQTTTTTLMLSERSGGTTQFAGAEEFRGVWLLEQALIDPLWRIISAPTDPGAPGRGP